MADRYALLGLARARSEWFRALAQWSTAAAIPAEFTKCVSAEELRAHLASVRPYSAVLLDSALPGTDRDLLVAARDAGCVPLVVSDGRDDRDWVALGAAAVLPDELTREQLLDVLASHATMVGRVDAVAAPDHPEPTVAAPWEGTLVAVCGAGGVGTSTVAMATAQGLARDERTGGTVALADLCLRADQAMLHDVGDVFPGVQELVEGHRSRQLSPEEVRALTFDIADRGYHLLLGLRRSRFWAALRPRALEAAVGGLRRAFRLTVCDVEADFEAEADGGSIDVEERCLMARTAVGQAPVVLAVGQPGVKGLHSMVRVFSDLIAAGVAPDRIQPVVNCGPRHARSRAAITGALAELTEPVTGGGMPPPVFLPRRKVEEAIRDGLPLPEPLPRLAAGAVHAALARTTEPAHPRTPVPVTPGSLGSWHDQEAG